MQYLDYDRELPSYLKGLEKCPVGSSKNLIKDGIFLNSQCKSKMHSVSVYQSPEQKNSQCF